MFKVRRPHGTYQKSVQGKCPLHFLHLNRVVCSNTLFSNTSASTNSLLFIRGRQVGDGMGGGRNGRVWGARFLAKTLENKAFFHKKMQNRGAPKTAVPTTTHPIPQLTPSVIQCRFCMKRFSNTSFFWSNTSGFQLLGPLARKHFLSALFESQQTPVFVTPVFCWGVFPIFRAKNRQKPQNKNPPLEKGGLVDSRESTNPRFRNPRFLFGVFFLYLGQKIGKNPKTKTPP